MTTPETKEPIYSIPEEYLQQGDIFSVSLVGPGADTEQRIFRSKDGRHGSVVFEEECDFKVFSRVELDTLLSQGVGTPLHTQPFYQTPDGMHEMVVTEAQLYSYFILASNTCDISGKDKTPFSWAIILPVVTLASQCQTKKIPFTKGEDLTPEEFVCKYTDMGDRLQGLTELEYMNVFWKILEDWLKQVQINNLREKVSKLKNYLMSLSEKIYMQYLPQHDTFQMPECIIDFTTVYTIPTGKLVAIKDARMACLETKMLVNFTQKFSNFFQRVAFITTPKPGGHR